MKPIRYILLTVTLCCLCQTVNSQTPPAGAEGHHSQITYSNYPGYYPELELTWSSWAQSYFYLTSRLLIDSAYQEIVNFPQHVMDSLSLVLLSKVPDYLALAMLELGLLPNYAAISPYVRVVSSLLNVGLNWSAATTQANNTTAEGLVQFDSILLNSLFSLKITDTNQLLMTLKPWPVVPELQEDSSHLAKSLVDLYQVLTTRNIQQCVLDSEAEAGSIRFSCDQEEASLDGILELDTDCVTFSWESVRPQHKACQFSKLQSSLLNCFSHAIKRQTRLNLPFLISECDATPPAQSLAQEGVEILNLTGTIESQVPRDFLVAIHRDNQTSHLVFTGAMAAVQSADSALQVMQEPSYYWPAMGISWQEQLQTLSTGTGLGFRLARMKVLRSLHDRAFLPLAYSRFRARYPAMSTERQNSGIAIAMPNPDQQIVQTRTAKDLPLEVTVTGTKESSVPQIAGSPPAEIPPGSEMHSPSSSEGLKNRPLAKVNTESLPPGSQSFFPGLPSITINDALSDSHSETSSLSLQSIDEIPEQNLMRRGSAPVESIQQHLDVSQRPLLERRMSSFSQGGKKLKGFRTPPPLPSQLMLPRHQQRRMSLPGRTTLKDVALLVKASNQFMGEHYSPPILNRPDQILAHPRQGMDPDHFTVVRTIARILAMAIFFRPINPENIDWIPLLLPTKDLRIKPKTADSTFAKGLMPARPEFSKLAGNPAAIAKAVQTLADLMNLYPELVTTKPLSLHDERLKKLLSQAAEVSFTLDPPEYSVMFEKHGLQWRQLARRNAETDRWDILMVDGSPFDVVAHPTLGYYIADYDPLIMAPPMSHHIVLSHQEGISPPHYSVVITRTYAREPDDTPVASYDNTETKVEKGIMTYSPAQSSRLKTALETDPKTNRLVNVYREILTIPRKDYLQNQWFKPLDLGDYDRVQLPMVNPAEILERLRPQIIRFLEQDLAGADEQLTTALAAVSHDNAQLFRSTILQQLLTLYHPESGLLGTLVISDNEILVDLWVTEFSSALETVPTEFYQRKSTELFHVERVRSYLILVEGLPDYLQGMDPLLGNISPRMQQVIKMTNQAIHRGAGLGMVHHGCDTGNPFSSIGDLCPATGLMPFSMSSYNTEVLITKPEGIDHMVTTLKSHGYHVPLNPNWHLNRRLRSSRFEWASSIINHWLSEEPVPAGLIDSDPVRYEITIEYDDCLNDPDLQSCFQRVLPRYLYEPFVQSSTSIRPSEVNGQIEAELDSNPASDIAN